MNYNKVIKDLKIRNDKLSEQYRLVDIRKVHLEYENNKLQQELKKRDEVIEKLKDWLKEENFTDNGLNQINISNKVLDKLNELEDRK